MDVWMSTKKGIKKNANDRHHIVLYFRVQSSRIVHECRWPGGLWRLWEEIRVQPQNWQMSSLSLHWMWRKQKQLHPQKALHENVHERWAYFSDFWRFNIIIKNNCRLITVKVIKSENKTQVPQNIKQDLYLLWIQYVQWFLFQINTGESKYG